MLSVTPTDCALLILLTEAVGLLSPSLPLVTQVKRAFDLYTALTPDERAAMLAEI